MAELTWTLTPGVVDMGGSMLVVCWAMEDIRLAGGWACCCRGCSCCSDWNVV